MKHTLPPLMMVGCMLATDSDYLASQVWGYQGWLGHSRSLRPTQR